jgi:sulfatase maturation enzyme AslB (radical SAM superfamily)
MSDYNINSDAKQEIPKYGTWCPVPWMSLNVRNTGDVRVCCNTNVSLNQGLIERTNGSNYNLGVDGIHDFRNAPLMKEIRRDMLSGKWNPSCIRCKRETESGMVARLDWERDIWKHHITEEHAATLTAEDGTIDVTESPLRYMDLRFGNLCNLKCRMCGPTDSNQWYDDQVQLWGDTYSDGGYKVKLISNDKNQYMPETNIYSWYNNSKFWEGMEAEINNIERLYIVGGEPLMINQHYEFLQQCIDRGRANNIVVEYNTNITNIPQRAWEIWKKFKRIQIGFSVDGVGTINDYIRYPSKWSYIEKNIQKLDNAEGNFKIWWAATIQVYNLLHLPELMLWRIGQDFKNINNIDHDRPIMTMHPLHNPQFLNVKIFPAKSKQVIMSQFENCKLTSRDQIWSHTWLTDDKKLIYYTKFCEYLDHYIKFMMSDDYSGQLDKFWHYTNKLDEMRGQSLRDVSPMTYDLLKINTN